MQWTKHNPGLIKCVQYQSITVMQLKESNPLPQMCLSFLPSFIVLLKDFFLPFVDDNETHHSVGLRFYIKSVFSSITGLRFYYVLILKKIITQ
jgi:hypothetical protein